jgi:oligopeptide/dipeptide ABC transporter ATP-binding protein
MYLGKIVEYAKTDELFETPLHPYTEVLLSSVPEIRTGEKAGPRRVVLKGDVPSPITIPAGCPFHPRCPKRFAPCDKVVPLLKEQNGRLVSCHLWNPA